MKWILYLEILYFMLVVFTSGRIILDTRSSTKTLAYLLAVFFIPFIGIIIYFTFGVNYKKKQIYSKKILSSSDLQASVAEVIHNHSLDAIAKTPQKILDERTPQFLLNSNGSPLTSNNKVEILKNGEDKFESVLKAIAAAERSIHIEYYIMENGVFLEDLEALLIQKAKEGVKIRIIYDDFGSRSIRKTVPEKWRAHGIEIYPFYKIKLLFFASRLNYRNHRKIIIIDGKIGFTGGINLSDRYSNHTNDGNFWRDTHIRLEGSIVTSLQAVFIADWNFCSKVPIFPTPDLFEGFNNKEGDKLVQIAAGGPDYPMPTILFSLLQAVYNANHYIYATTPYYIPDESLQNALCVMAKSGLDVRLIVPYVSDSKLVDAASRSYFKELLQAGVRIYRYKKGFVHAKTLVIDDALSIIGTANLDYRSFDLNFEVNAIIYNGDTAQELRQHFEEDLSHSEEIDFVAWSQRSKFPRLLDKIAGLISPLL